MEENILLWNPTAGFCSKLLELDDLTREGNIMLGDFVLTPLRMVTSQYFLYTQCILIINML